MRGRWSGATALGFGVLAAMLGTSAWAQTVPPAGASPPSAAATQAVAAPSTQVAPPAADSSQVADIVVTAQRREESLSHVGVTVNAVGAAELAQRGFDQAQDLVKIVPGFQATQSFNGNPVYTLRGVGFDSTNAYATSPIGIYTDQVAIPYPYMSQGLLFDLARVEALKGPQGTLYGRNATGGLVNYVTQAPTDHFAAGATVEAGSYSTLNATAYVSGPLMDGVKARFAFNTQNRYDGWQHSVTRDEDLGVLHQNAFRFTADFDRGGPFTATLTGAYWDKNGDAEAPQSILYINAASPFANQLGLASVIKNPSSDTQADWVSKNHQPQSAQGIFHAPPSVDSQFGMVSLKLGYRLSPNLRLESLTSYDNLKARNVSDLAGLQVEANYQDVRNNIESLSQEVRLLGDFGRFTWSAGGYYANDTGTDRELGYNDENSVVATLRYLATLVPTTRFTPQQIAHSFGNYVDYSTSNTNVEAGFVNGEYKFNDLFRISGGARYTRDSESTNACTYDYNGTNIPVIVQDYPLLGIFPKNSLAPGQCYTLNSTNTAFLLTPLHERQVQHNVSWRAAADFTPNDRTLIYATISRGYKAGGFPLLAASNANQFAPVKQEELTAYEIGTKLGLLDRRIQLNSSFFYYDYNNKQVLGRVADPIFSTLVRIQNVPESHVYGIDGDVTWRITHALSAHVAGVYQRSEIDRYMNFDEFSNVVNFKGKPFAYTPKVQVNGGFNYDAPITSDLRLSASLEAAYQSETNGSFAELPQFHVRSHTITDGTVGVVSANGKWRADVYAKNLFNIYYWTGVTSATDSVFRFAGMPREVGVRLTYTY